MTSFVAVYGLYGCLAVAAIVWLRAPRVERLDLRVVVATSIAALYLGLVAARLLMKFMGKADIDSALIHTFDNGFVSGHTALAAAIALAIAARHRLIAGGLGMAAVAVGAAEVAAGAHDWPDIAMGLALGVLAAVIGYAVFTLQLRRDRLFWHAYDVPPDAILFSDMTDGDLGEIHHPPTNRWKVHSEPAPVEAPCRSRWGTPSRTHVPKHRASSVHAPSARH